MTGESSCLRQAWSCLLVSCPHLWQGCAQTLAELWSTLDAGRLLATMQTRGRPGRTPAQIGVATGDPRSRRQRAAASQTAQAVLPTVTVTASAPPGNHWGPHHSCNAADKKSLASCSVLWPSMNTGGQCSSLPLHVECSPLSQQSYDAVQTAHWLCQLSLMSYGAVACSAGVTISALAAARTRPARGAARAAAAAVWAQGQPPHRPAAARAFSSHRAPNPWSPSPCSPRRNRRQVLRMRRRQMRGRALRTPASRRRRCRPSRAATPSARRGRGRRCSGSRAAIGARRSSSWRTSPCRGAHCCASLARLRDASMSTPPTRRASYNKNELKTR